MVQYWVWLHWVRVLVASVYLVWSLCFLSDQNVPLGDGISGLVGLKGEVQYSHLSRGDLACPVLVRFGTHDVHHDGFVTLYRSLHLSFGYGCSCSYRDSGEDFSGPPMIALPVIETQNSQSVCGTLPFRTNYRRDLERTC